MDAFRAERAPSPLDRSVLWVVLDPELVVHREASDFFLRALQGAGRSPHTVRVYAEKSISTERNFNYDFPAAGGCFVVVLDISALLDLGTQSAVVVHASASSSSDLDGFNRDELTDLVV